MNPRFYCPSDVAGPLAEGIEIVLPKEAAHHAVRVLRLRVGDAIALFDGSGAAYAATLTTTANEVRARIERREDSAREAPLDITLVQALAVADKMDWIVQKAVELGVRAVQPIAAERSVLRLDGERAAKRLAHWRQIAQSAAEQCGRDRLTVIHPIQPLSTWLAATSGGERWILDPQVRGTLRTRSAPAGPLALLVGPEGGWSDAELACAASAGCIPTALGPRVLRTETAGVAAVSAILALWGDF